MLAWVAAVVALALAATPPAVPIPPLNQKVLEFARERIGKKVADGQCLSLAVEALRYAGAKRYPFDPSGDFVWGRPVASFKEALPGDILQFRNAVFQGKRWITKRRWVSWHHEYPHHTAIVSEVREGGRVVAILHQNVGAHDADDATKQVVQEASIRPESLQDGGAVAIYRPVARDEAENPEIRHDVPIARRTEVAIRGDSFLINGRPTYQGRSWKGRSIEGLLLNSRMVQGIFDDLNPETRSRWAYPDTKLWDPERNTREFLAAMPLWRDHGLLAFTINLQGGSPQGYSKGRQTWHNSAITALGDLRPEYLDRLARILDRADELGIAVILGLFYFGQDERLKDEAAVVRAARSRDRLDPRPRLQERPDRSEQRVQHRLRSRDSEARPCSRADRARQSAGNVTAADSWSVRATAVGPCPARTSFAPPTSCSCTATACGTLGESPRWSARPAQCRVIGQCPSSSMKTITSTSTSLRTTSNPHFRRGLRGVTSTRARRTTAMDISHRQ